LKGGGFIFLENMNHNDDRGKFSSFVFLNDEKNRRMNYAYPYLWKANPSDADYQESWGDPRIKKEKKTEKQQEFARMS